MLREDLGIANRRLDTHSQNDRIKGLVVRI
jgi:hypothetical protein